MLSRWMFVGCLVALTAGCRTTGSVKDSATSSPPLRTLRGTLQLIDGTPVPFADLRLLCGNWTRSSETDHSGRFLFSNVPEGSCVISSAKAEINETIRVSADVLRRVSDIRLTVPPMHRLEIAWKSRDKEGIVHIDESLPLRIEVSSDQPAPIALVHVVLTVERHLMRIQWWLNKGIRTVSRTDELIRFKDMAPGFRLFQKRPSLEVRSIQHRAWMPLSLRSTPLGGEAAHIPLLDEKHSVVHLPAAQRLVVYLDRCDHPDAPLLDALWHLVHSHNAIGMKAAAVASQPCTKIHAPFPFLRGGPEILWALQAKPGDIVVLDQDGRVAFRTRAAETGSLDEVVAHLEETWPVFAAKRRVSLQPASSVQVAKTERLLSQAKVQLETGQFPQAHQTLDRVLQITPNLAEARKQRALTRARLGDLSGALRDVSWWRTSFGHESADELMDQIKRVSSRR